MAQQSDRDEVVSVRGTTRETPSTGYTAAAGAETVDVAIPEAYNLMRDRVRWGPIIAGFLTALTTLVLLGVLGAAIGFSVVNAGEVAARDAAPAAAGPFSAIWGALSGLVAFGLGGYVAGKTAAVFDRRWGAFNGAMVFFLAVPVTLWLATTGLGALVGTLGSFASALNADPATAQSAAQQAAGQAQGAAAAAQQATPAQVAAAAAAVRDAAWATLLGLGVALGASALGGMLGARREVEIDPAAGRVADR